jgi:ClpP class serine protease
MDKKQLIQQIEALRKSRVITYLTSDRSGPVNARVAMDIIPVISKQLQKIGKTQNIDLFLYSTGGDTMVPWRLVSMIREYCDKFSVLVPYKAHSAATMIALGADEVVMTDLSGARSPHPLYGIVANTYQKKLPRAMGLYLGKTTFRRSKKKS